MKKVVFGLAIGMLLGAAIIAGAQVPSLLLSSPTGLEQIEVLVPSTTGVVTSPQKVQVTINQIRNSGGYTLVAAGTTVTTNMTNLSGMAIAQGAITTWNINLPPAPADGQDFTETCPGGNVGTLTIAATLPAGVAIVGTNPTSCTAATPTSATFKYSLSANTWYRAS
jgi:hypothetical protein